jgi:uncharacterized membrane protein
MKSGRKNKKNNDKEYKKENLMNVKNVNPKKSVNYVNRTEHSARNLWSGFLFGIGLVAFIDETVFHQLLHWHHFYDKSTTEIGLISDGLFHSLSWFATIASLFLFADLRRRNALWLTRWWGGVLLGAGAFQLYDGTIQHKLMGLHQIRYNVVILPYDLTWNITAIAMIIVGSILMGRTRSGYQTIGADTSNAHE